MQQFTSKIILVSLIATIVSPLQADNTLKIQALMGLLGSTLISCIAWHSYLKKGSSSGVAQEKNYWADRERANIAKIKPGQEAPSWIGNSCLLITASLAGFVGFMALTGNFYQSNQILFGNTKK